jgi:hypothetical protein
MTQDRDFPVAAVNPWSLLWIWIPLIAVGFIILCARGQATGLANVEASGLHVLFLLVLGAALTWIYGRRHIVLKGRDLRVTATLYRKRVPVDALGLANARIVDLAEHTDLRPLLKTRGFRLPGFAAGHFRLRDLRKTFCLLTERSRVLVLPLRDGTLLLLSPEKPQALLQQLQELADQEPRH